MTSRIAQSVLGAFVLAAGVSLGVLAHDDESGAANAETGITWSGDTARSRYNIRTLTELYANSADVVVGRVIEVRPGRTVREEDLKIAFVEVDISVTSATTIKDPRITIEFMLFPAFENGLPMPGFESFDLSQIWWQPGAEVLMFVNSHREGVYHFVGPDGLYFLPQGADGAIRATYSEQAEQSVGDAPKSVADVVVESGVDQLLDGFTSQGP